MRPLTRLAAGDACRALGDHPAAERCYRQALRMPLAEDAVETADAFLWLADLPHADVWAGEAAEVGAQWEAWRRRAAPGQGSPITPRAVTKLGTRAVV